MHFRLIEETEEYQITYDDGPGSTKFPDVVKSETRILEEWFGDELTKEEVLVEIREHRDHFIPPWFEDKGVSFYLQYREDDTSEWRGVGQV